MEKHNIKLIAIMDSCNLHLYEAQGLKITKGPNDIKLPFPHHDRAPKDHGSYDTSSGHSVSGSDPHTMPKAIDRNNSAKIICEYLDKLFEGKSDYKELIITADPKMLGVVRDHLSKHLREKITLEIDKDLVDQSISTIEHALFGK